MNLLFYKIDDTKHQNNSKNYRAQHRYEMSGSGGMSDANQLFVEHKTSRESTVKVIEETVGHA